MAEFLTLSVDAMGGDEAPNAVVEGVDIIARRINNVRFLLFGDEQQLTPLLDKYHKARQACEIRHTSKMISADDQPAIALRSGRESSMRLAINAVGSGEAAGIVSAGNTGALMAMAKFVLKTLPGIDRPAIASYFPTERGKSIMLDLGANIECNSKNLVQFAVMGEVFARNVLGLEKPTVGILNVGVENLKGNDTVKGAAAILQAETHLPIKFYGFVEGNDIAAGTVDVVVTDGFTGNVALKTAEGTAKLFVYTLRQALTSSTWAKLGALFARPAISLIRQKLDPRLHNGAIFLGLNGICIKSHGGTDALGFSNALQMAIDLTDRNINESIRSDYEKLCADASNISETVAVP